MVPQISVVQARYLTTQFSESPIPPDLVTLEVLLPLVLLSSQVKIYSPVNMEQGTAENTNLPA